MNARVAGHADGLTVYWRGDVDIQHSPAARSALLAAVSKGRAVTVDLTEVRYLDTSGVASLVEAYDRARAAQQAFRLAGAGDQVLKMLQLARLDAVFEFA